MTSTIATPTATGLHLASALDVGYRLVLGMTEDFTDETYTVAPAGHKPLAWFVGHLTCAKDYFSTLHQDLPKAVSEQFSDNFADGVDTDYSTAPPLAEMVAMFQRAHGLIRDFVLTLEPEDLTRRCPVEPDPNLAEFAAPFMILGDALALTQLHDSFHAGQMAQMRRALGMTSPV